MLSCQLEKEYSFLEKKAEKSAFFLRETVKKYKANDLYIFQITMYRNFLTKAIDIVNELNCNTNIYPTDKLNCHNYIHPTDELNCLKDNFNNNNFNNNNFTKNYLDFINYMETLILTNIKKLKFIPIDMEKEFTSFYNKNRIINETKYIINFLNKELENEKSVFKI